MSSYARNMKQANREALMAVVGLVATILVWIVSGFGVSTFDITVFHTPLWIITGTLGTWAFAVIVAVIMARKVITDIDFEDAEADHE